MSGSVFVQTLVASKKNGPTKNTLTTAVSLLNPEDLYTFQPGALQIGAYLRISALLSLSTTSSAPTFNLNVVLGGVAVWASGNVTSTTTANTTLPYLCNVMLRMNAVGSGTNANFVGWGQTLALGQGLASGANPTITDTGLLLPTTTPAAGTGFDNTISAILDFQGGFGTSAAGNQWILNAYVVELLNQPI